MTVAVVPHLFQVDTDVELPTGGNQTITTADLGGLIPKAVYFFWSKAETLATNISHAHLGGGATDGTRQWAHTGTSAHNQPVTTDNERRGVKDACILISSGLNGVEAKASFVAFVVDGITINWPAGSVPDDAYHVGALFIAGTDATVYADTVAVGDIDVPVDVIALGFQLQGMIMSTHADAMDDTSSGVNDHTIGFVSFDGTTLNQTCWGVIEGSGRTLSEPLVTFSSTVASLQPSATTGWEGKISDVDSQGFTITPEVDSAAGDEIGYLAFKFNDTISVKAGFYIGPTSAVLHQVTDVGFKPRTIMMGPTWHTGATDTDAEDLRAGSQGIAAFDDGLNQFCVSAQIEDAQLPTDTQSFVNTKALHLPEDDGTVGNEADFSKMLDTGFELNYTQVHASGGSHNVPYIAFGADPVVPEELQTVFFGTSF